MTFPFEYNFEAYLIIPYDFLKSNFSHFIPQDKLFFVEKGILNFKDINLRVNKMLFERAKSLFGVIFLSFLFGWYKYIHLIRWFSI